MSDEVDSEAEPSRPGFYGKLPAHGDFVQRGLSPDYIESWDDWLQTVIASSRENLGEMWLETYLTSPVWQFMLSSRLLGATPWLGILIPSVDKVGRYFPFTVACPLERESSSPHAFFDNSSWFYAMEAHLLNALENSLEAETIEQDVASRLPEQRMAAMQAGREDSWPLVANSDSGLGGCAALLGGLLEIQKEEPYSIWRTSGSSRVPASTHLVSGLPSAKHYTAMLDATWQPALIAE